MAANESEAELILHVGGDDGMVSGGCAPAECRGELFRGIEGGVVLVAVRPVPGPGDLISALGEDAGE